MQQGLGFSGDWKEGRHKDVVSTPPHVAEAMVRHFPLTGRVLDPCRGDRVFWNLIPGADYCELQEGSDFFEWSDPVDWVIGNPPYSIYSEWLAHSMVIANNIVYLIPINKAFNSTAMLASTYAWGGIVEIVHVGPGSSLKFPVGFAIGAVHYMRNWKGGITYRHEWPVYTGGATE